MVVLFTRSGNHWCRAASEKSREKVMDFLHYFEAYDAQVLVEGTKIEILKGEITRDAWCLIDDDGDIVRITEYDPADNPNYRHIRELLNVGQNI